ncbi:MAG: hypothetical protein HPY53_05880 [Brevinematales bacterium]|nr:hypothetical protein [Brevinematales bacterium]
MKHATVSILLILSFVVILRAEPWTGRIHPSAEMLIVSYTYYYYEDYTNTTVKAKGNFSLMMWNDRKYLVTFKSPGELKGVKVLYLDGKVWEYLPQSGKTAMVDDIHWGGKIAGVSFAPPYSFFHYPGMGTITNDCGNLSDLGFWVQLLMIGNSPAQENADGKQKFSINLIDTWEIYSFVIENKLINVTFDNDPFDPAKLGQK